MSEIALLFLVACAAGIIGALIGATAMACINVAANADRNETETRED